MFGLMQELNFVWGCLYAILVFILVFTYLIARSECIGFLGFIIITYQRYFELYDDCTHAKTILYHFTSELIIG